MSDLSLRQPLWYEKAIAWDAATKRVPPSVGIYDTPHKYICMNAEWASIIAGMIYRLTYHEVWEGDVDEREDAIEEIERLLADMANPCCPPTMMDLVINLYNTNITNITTVYNDAAQDETVVAPDMVYGDADDDYRDIIMCMVSQIIIAGMAQSELDRRIAETWVWSGAGNALALLGTALAGITGGWSLLGGAIAGAILNLAAASWRDMSQATLTDSDAIEAVACCLYLALDGSLPDATTFGNALSGCGFDAGSPEEELRVAVAPLLADLSFYLAFISSLNEMLPVAKTGVLDEACPCVEPPATFMHTFDFTIDDGGWTDQASTNRPYGEWEIGVGWKSEYGGASEGIPNDERLYIKREGFPVRFITTIELYFTSTGVQGGPTRSQSLLLYEGGVPGNLKDFGGYIVPDTWMETTDTDDDADAIWIFNTGASSSDNMEMVCTKIIVWGNGSDPF